MNSNLIFWLRIELKRNSDLSKERHTTHIDNWWIIIKVLDISYTKRWVVRLHCSCIEIMQLCIFYKIWTWMVIKSALEPILVDFCLASFNFFLILSSYWKYHMGKKKFLTQELLVLLIGFEVFNLIKSKYSNDDSIWFISHEHKCIHI